MDNVLWFRPDTTGGLASLGEFTALVAPQDLAETPTPTSEPLTRAACLYIRSPEPPPVQPGDVVQVRGVRVRVVRTPQLWKTRTGKIRGLVITIQWKEGIA